MGFRSYRCGAQDLVFRVYLVVGVGYWGIGSTCPGFGLSASCCRVYGTLLQLVAKPYTLESSGLALHTKNGSSRTGKVKDQCFSGYLGLRRLSTIVTQKIESLFKSLQSTGWYGSKEEGLEDNATLRVQRLQ